MKELICIDLLGLYCWIDRLRAITYALTLPHEKTHSPLWPIAIDFFPIAQVNQCQCEYTCTQKNPLHFKTDCPCVSCRRKECVNESQTQAGEAVKGSLMDESIWGCSSDVQPGLIWVKHTEQCYSSLVFLYKMTVLFLSLFQVKLNLNLIELFSC